MAISLVLNFLGAWGRPSGSYSLPLSNPSWRLAKRGFETENHNPPKPLMFPPLITPLLGETWRPARASWDFQRLAKSRWGNPKPPFTFWTEIDLLHFMSRFEKFAWASLRIE